MRIYASQRRFFANAYATGEKGWGTVDPERPFVRFAERIPRKRGAKVLDIGCGEGRHSRLFAGLGYQVYGIDYCRAALLSARAVTEKASLRKRMHWVEGDALSLPFGEDAFDIALDYGCFHHVCKRDWRSYFAELCRVLRPKGYFLLACFSEHYKHAPEDVRKRSYLVHRGHYDHFFTKEELMALLRVRFLICALEGQRDGGDAFWFALLRQKE